VDVEAEPTLGDVVCGSRADGNWRSVLRKSTKGTERSYAAGELYGDVQRYGEWRNDKHGADSVHGAIRRERPRQNCFGSDRRDVENVRVKRLAANEQADRAQLLACSRVMHVVQFVVKVILN
jgi:hypothetical protein